MTTSPLERAILSIPRTGWVMVGLSRSPFDSIRPWHCDLVPGHLGPYHHGTPRKSGLYTVYDNPQARITSEGKTALDAVENALSLLDKHPAKAVYLDLERAFEEAVDERTDRT